MARLASAKRLIFRTACRFVADKVGPCTAQAGRTHRLVGIDHNLIVGGLLDCIQIMVDEPLAEVVASGGNYLAYITALHGIVAIVFHKLVGFIHATFVVADRA